MRNGYTKDTKNLVGSKSHDCFRAFHKTALDKKFYASDVDLMLISKNPPGIVAAIEYKAGDYDKITFSEAILYNTLTRTGIPVYIVTCNEWRGSNAFTRFKVEWYVSGDWRQNPPAIKVKPVGNFNQKGFEAWEGKLRSDFSKAHGAK